MREGILRLRDRDRSGQRHRRQGERDTPEGGVGEGSGGVRESLTASLPFQIPIAASGIRAMGFLMRHQLRTEGLAVNQRVVTQFVKVKLEGW